MADASAALDRGEGLTHACEKTGQFAESALQRSQKGLCILSICGKSCASKPTISYLLFLFYNPAALTRLHSETEFPVMRAKKLTIALLLLTSIIGVALVGAWVTLLEPPKVTDPDDPRFDPMRFRFEDYRESGAHGWDLVAVLLKMFPPGTDKEFIERILVHQARLRSVPNAVQPDAVKRNGHVLQQYRKDTFFNIAGYLVNVEYDENSKSRSLYYGGTRLYGAALGARYKGEPEVLKDLREELERKMRPIRQKYIGSADGLLDGENNAGK